MEFFARLRERAVVLMALLLISIVGCSAPQYDEQTDKLLTQLQSDFDTQVLALIRLDQRIDMLARRTDLPSAKALTDAKTKAGYEANGAFYDKMDVELTAIRMRYEGRPAWSAGSLNSAVQALFDVILSGEKSMKNTHEQSGILSSTYLQITRKIVDAQIGALLTREVGLKGGSSSALTTSSTTTRK